MIPQFKYTSTDLARTFGVSTVSIRAWAESGVLTGIKTPGGKLRFSRQDVDALRARLALPHAQEAA